MRNLLRDVRVSARLLARSPGFTLVAIVVLALAIGANTAIFSVANALLLKPLAADAPGELVGVYARERTRPDSYRAFSYPDLVDLRGARDVFDRIAGFELAIVGVTEGETTRRAYGGFVSSDYFATVGSRLALGRSFTSDEERPGNPPVVILSDHYWRAHGADPSVLGRTVTINATPFTVVGVTPSGFTGTMALFSLEFWLPTGASGLLANETLRGTREAGFEDRAARSLVLVARLRPGLNREQAVPLLAALSERLERAWPVENKGLELQVHPLARLATSTAPQDDSEVTLAFAFLMGMAAIVLLIACLNLANVLLARGAARRRETAVRLAIGGGRWQIVRPLLIEALMLAASGGAVGLGLGVLATRLLADTLVPLVPFAVSFEVAPDWRVLAATAGFAALAASAFGLGPALRLTRPGLVNELKAQPGSLGGDGRRRGDRLGNALVIGQVALSLVLLTAGGLFLQSARKAASADLGLPLDGGVMVSLDPSLARYDRERARRVTQEVLSRVRATPGVAAASVASSVPLGDYSDGCSVRPAGAPPGARPTFAMFTIVGADYFRALGVSVLRGREFTAAEEAHASPVRPAIIDRTLAERLWPGGDPLGQQLRLGDEEPGKTPELVEVVGVVPSILQGLFDREAMNLYVPYGSTFRAGLTLHVRGRRAGPLADEALLGEVQRRIREVDARLPVLAARTLRGHRDSSMHLWIARTGARLFSTLAGIAWLLAATGLYGVRACVVSRRTREIGIRMAVGASPGVAKRLIVGEGLRLAAVGIGAGLVMALPVCRLLAGWVYGADSFNPGVIVGAPLVLLASLLAASYLPARRATSIEPMAALRQD